MGFSNSYEDTIRAEAYSKLTFTGTYYLAFRDVPDLITTYVKGTNALDFGCGTGRSTRFLQSLGFHTTGVDIAHEMITIAKQLDNTGTYQCIKDGDFCTLPVHFFDLILSAFTFDNIPTKEKKIVLFTGLARLLSKDGILINIVSSPDIYTHEWASFSTKDFPENNTAKTGDRVKIITKDITDKRPCDDILWNDRDYQKVYTASKLTVVETLRPLATGTESYTWVNETQIAPWVIYILQPEA